MRVYLGKVVSFHGVKGEIKIRSSFPFKDKAFQIGTYLYIDKESYKIISYRRHKDYEMVRLEGYDHLDQVLSFKNKKVYKDKAALNLSNDEVLDEELLSFTVLTNHEKKGMIKEIFLASKTNKILRIEVGEKEYLIPYHPDFVKKIDKVKQTVEIEWIAW